MTELEKLFEAHIKTVGKMYTNGGEIGDAIWHLQDQDGKHVLCVTPFGGYEDKKAISMMLRQQFKEQNIVRYVFISEVWFATFPKGMPTDQLDGRISLMPNRKEAVLLIGEDRDTGEEKVVTMEIDRSGDKPVLKPMDELTTPEQSKGIFTKMFKDHEMVKH